MKVWLVYESAWESDSMLGVFDSEEAANAFIREYSVKDRGLYVEDWDVRTISEFLTM
jgi:hypothetical protein